jgi:predicted pyridoxine 5'-phosphate oxidase superfamily flavin-nucleotide-binding protein
MSILPEHVKSAWNERNGAVVFTTVDKAGAPNAIYVTCVNLHGDDKIVIADNYFVKTLENIKKGSRGAVLFITNDKKSYQIKGDVEYHTSGVLYDEMKKWNPSKHPGRAATVINVQEVFCGAERLV